MNLQKKNTRYLLLTLPMILLACSLLFFFLLVRQTDHLQRTQLELKQRNVLATFPVQGPLPAPAGIRGEYSLLPARSDVAARLNRLRDTVLFYPKGRLPFKMLTMSFQRDGNSYELTAFSSSLEITHLMIAVFSIQGFIYLVLLFSIVLINRRIASRLWKPFYATLAELLRYDLNGEQQPALPDNTGISEFDELNRTATLLIQRNHQAYSSQKQFVEHASHEIQTPLAVIRAKVELLMEQPALDGWTARQITEIAAAGDRLSRLSKTLLLLSKIENGQFNVLLPVNITALIQSLLAGFADQYMDDYPPVDADLQTNVIWEADPTLMEILFSNLIRNAIVHNRKGGFIRISLRQHLFVIENPGQPLTVAPELLFERFRTGNEREKGYGLGLALVHQIAVIYGLPIRYLHAGDIHRLELGPSDS